MHKRFWVIGKRVAEKVIFGAVSVLFIAAFIQQVLIQFLLYVRNCFRHWRNISEIRDKSLCSCKGDIPITETDNKQGK